MKNTTAKIVEDIEELIEAIENKLHSLPLRTVQRSRLVALISDFPEEVDDALQLSSTEW